MIVYIASYLVLGVFALLLLRYATLKAQDEEPFEIPDFSEKTWVDKFVIPAIGYTVILLAWPAVVVGSIISKIRTRFSKSDDAALEPKEFVVQRENLRQQMTVEEIEQVETVFDPLGAAPNIPFGHLNATWIRFKQGLTDEDALWSFGAYDSTGWGHKVFKEGYVAVNDDGIGPYFLTTRKYEDE